MIAVSLCSSDSRICALLLIISNVNLNDNLRVALQSYLSNSVLQ